MSVDKAREYLRRYTSDADFRDGLDGASPDERRGLLEQAGFGDLSREHLERAHSDHVDDADLDDVSGGTSSNMAAEYLEAMQAYYTSNSQDIINKGDEMANNAANAQAIANAEVQASNWRASH